MSTPELLSSTMLLLCFAAFFAGLVDAVVGGGGLIQIPALFSGLPRAEAATLFGTNKLSSIWGTSVAALRYGRSVRIEWATALPGALSALIFAFVGAYAVTQVPGGLLRAALPFILAAVAVYTFLKKDFGALHAPLHRGRKERTLAVLVGGAIGFYDGFFGPGTGSFLIFLYIRFFGFDFLGASAAAKIVNVACNLAALAWFWPSGHVLVAMGLAMAAFNVAGALVGSRLAIRHGSAFVRKLFLAVVTALIAKTAIDALKNIPL